MRLAETRHGPAAGTPLVIAHGLFGAARNWGAIARRLAADRPVIAVDLRNHGASPRADSHGYGDLAADLAETVAAHGGVADLLGHSMGGKAAMRLALERPALVRRLIVADIAPVAYAHSQRPLVAAMQALPLDAIASRAEADRRLAPAVPDRGLRAFLLAALDLSVRPPRWRLNLPVLAAEMDRITGWEAVPGRFEGPALFLSGARSDYLRPGHHAAIRAQFPAARFETIEGAGHWLHAERPEAVLDAVARFLAGPA
jgi:pimeloyl-ACP methyl ester carboxylesterase